MIMKFKAPYRVCFTGGLLDIFPINIMTDGVTVNTAINKFVTVEVDDDKPFNIISESGDDTIARFLAKLYGITKGEYKIKHDLPKCSGMGGSAALGVCLSYAFGDRNRQNICTNSYYIENLLMGVVGGNQDQFASAFGGFNIVQKWGHERVVPDENFQKLVLSELEFRIRDDKTSGEENKKILKDYMNGSMKTVNILENIKKYSAIAGNCLQLGDAHGFIKAVKKENHYRYMLTPREGTVLAGISFEPLGVRRCYYYEE